MTAVGLLTDFGVDDPYVAELKAALLERWAELGREPPGPLVDLCHTVPRGDVAAGAWFLRRLRDALPRGAVTVAVIDPGVGTDRPAVAAAARGRFWVAPGNGLLAFLAAEPDLRVALLDDPRLHRAAAPDGGPSRTFHGRDVFAPAAARLAAGGSLADLGGRGGAEHLGPAPAAPPADGRLGTVVWVDRFGNAVTDLPRRGAVGDALAAGATVVIGEVALAGPHPTFGAAPPGRPFWYWGSGGTLEAALPGGDAAAACGWRRGMALRRDDP